MINDLFRVEDEFRASQKLMPPTRAMQETKTGEEFQHEAHYRTFIVNLDSDREKLEERRSKSRKRNFYTEEIV